MDAVKRLIASLKVVQWVLVGIGLVGAAAALSLGVADNPPGIVALYSALVCWAGAWIWNWRAPREFWTLALAALLASALGVILHNLFSGLQAPAAAFPLLADLAGFLGVFAFLVGVMAAPAAGLAALVGGIIVSWRGMDRLCASNRSYRRFDEKHRLREKTLRKLVQLARLSASSANLQPLKFVLSWTRERNQQIFPFLSWAGYLKEWPGPVEGERPAAYILLLGDRQIGSSFQYDAGIASQSITLGAAERGLGACLIGSIQRQGLRKAIGIPERYEILLVIALGKPAETVVLEDLDPERGIHYWRDSVDRHHVPKRIVEELILDL